MQGIDRKNLLMLIYDVKKEDLQKVSNNSKNFELIFNHFDKLDRKSDMNLKTATIFGVDSKFLRSITKEIHTGEDRGKVLGDIDFIIDDAKLEQYIADNPDLKGVKKEDVYEFLNNVITAHDNVVHEEAEKTYQAIKGKYPDLPDEIINSISDNESIKVVNKNGKTFYDVTDEEGNYRRLNEKGNTVVFKSEVLAMGESADYYNTLGGAEEWVYLNDDGEQIGSRYKYSNGVVDIEDYKSGRKQRLLGKSIAAYTNDNKLDSININKGLGNETQLKCEYDNNGKLKDIKMIQKQDAYIPNSDGYTMTVDTPIKMNDKNKKALSDLINSGAKFGEDFSIDLENNEVKINPMIQNDSEEEMPPIPDNVKEEILNLSKQGLRNNRDFTVKYTKDGRFEIDFNTAKGRDNATDETRIGFSKDGKIKTTTKVNGDTVTTTVENGSHKTTSNQSREDAFMEKILSGEFDKAVMLLGDIRPTGRDFKVMGMYKKYQQLTGKNFAEELIKAYDNKKIDAETYTKLISGDASPLGMGASYCEPFDGYVTREDVIKGFNESIKAYEAIEEFDVKNSQIGALVPKSSKEKISDNKYIETTDGKQITVSRDDNSIAVEKNGKSFKIDVSHLSKNIKNLLYNTDANILYRLAEKGTELELYSNIGRTGLLDESVNGYYVPDENKIYLNSETLTGSILTRTLAHETGHTFYNAREQEKDEHLENLFNEELKAFQNSDEKYKEGNHSYCTASVYEAVAESYALLTTGTSKSEYTLAKHFPKTFAYVKEMIEKEQNK